MVTTILIPMATMVTDTIALIVTKMVETIDINQYLLKTFIFLFIIY